MSEATRRPGLPKERRLAELRRLAEVRRLAGGGLFGRQKGKKLRGEQQRSLETVLPALQIALPAKKTSLDPRILFPFEAESIILEIGFGGGEHLLHRAFEAPGAGFIGVEPFLNGVAKVTSIVGQRAMQNIRLHHGDAIDVLAALADASLDRIDILYPDPWPKRRQRKRRFVSAPALGQMARVLRPGGLLRFASDIDDYLGWTLALVARAGAFRWEAETATGWRRPYPGWPGTRYEAKALREDRIPTYLTFIRLNDADAGPA